MRKLTKNIAFFFLTVMGYYLLPDAYLLPLHPHEHDNPVCCKNFKEQTTVDKTPLVCQEKEEYKQVHHKASPITLNFIMEPVKHLIIPALPTPVLTNIQSHLPRAPPLFRLL